MNMPNMPAGMPMMPGMHQSETNLLSVLVNLAFGFFAGLMIFLGASQVIAYGSSLAGELLKMTGGQQMGAFGFAATAAPYIVLGPIAGLMLKELASVRSIKSFAYFVAAVLGGFAIAFVSKGYFATLISP